GIDVAGEDEEAEDAALRSLKPRKDSTAVTICEVFWGSPPPGPSSSLPAAPGGGIGDSPSPQPSPARGKGVLQANEPYLRVVQHYWWTGRKHRELFPQLVDLLKRVWHCRAVV